MRFGPLHGFLMECDNALDQLSECCTASFVQIGNLDGLLLGSQQSLYILVFQFQKTFPVCLRCCLMGFLGQRENF